MGARLWIPVAGVLGALLGPAPALAAAPPAGPALAPRARTASAATALAPAPEIDIEPVHLKVAVVLDPDFPAIDEPLARSALALAAVEFSRRFNVPVPSFELAGQFTVAEFLDEHANPADPRCQPLYAARYRGGGEAELGRHRDGALRFFQKWSLESLRGFIDEPARAAVRTYEDVYAHYAKHYSATVAAISGLKTPAGTPLVDPGRSARRSFVAWTCALLRQEDYDVILTNTFILADLLTEPHPHAVFGKAKIGGIASRSPARAALDGQALLATTFGIDTSLEPLAELPAGTVDFRQRARILGIYLLAHEIAHAVFGIPDVYDHPKGCLMTSRPGFTYLDGLRELDENPTPCPRCRPYVEARAVFDRAGRMLSQHRFAAAIAAATAAAKALPAQFHGSRKKRMAEIVAVASRAYRALGNAARAGELARAASGLDPDSAEIADLLRAGGSPATPVSSMAPGDAPGPQDARGSAATLARAAMPGSVTGTATATGTGAIRHR